MRISDWSSDVCSSDLGPRRVSLDRLPVPAIFHTQHDPSGQSRDTHNQQCQEHDGFHVSLSLVLTSRPGPWTCCLRSYLRRPRPRTKWPRFPATVPRRDQPQRSWSYSPDPTRSPAQPARSCTGHSLPLSAYSLWTPSVLSVSSRFESSAHSAG